MWGPFLCVAPMSNTKDFHHGCGSRDLNSIKPDDITIRCIIKNFNINSY